MFFVLDVCRKDGGSGKIRVYVLVAGTLPATVSGVRPKAGSVPAFRVTRDKRCVGDAAKIYRKT